MKCCSGRPGDGVAMTTQTPQPGQPQPAPQGQPQPSGWSSGRIALLVSAAIACLVLGLLGGVAVGRSTDNGSTQTVTQRTVANHTTTVNAPPTTVTDTQTETETVTSGGPGT
jgi:hypothetical protein